MTTASWSFAVSAWTLALGGLALLVLARMAVLNARRNGAKFIPLEALKMLAACLLVFTLCRPERVSMVHRRETPLVAVLCDASDSMNTEDVVASNGAVIARSKWLGALKEAEFWTPLEKKYKVAVNDFAAPPADENDPKGEDAGTDLNLALEDAAAGYKDLRAVLLLTDGDWNLGKSPVSAATRLRMRNVPVFTILAGSEKYLPDIELQNTIAPAYGLMDERVAVGFTLQSRMRKDVRTTVTLRGPDGVNAVKDVTIPAMGQVQDMILLTPRSEGRQTFRLSVPKEKDEVITDNNSREFQITLRREVLKVLVVDCLPRWEYRYLRNALSRDPGMTVKCLLLQEAGMKRGDGRDYIAQFPAGMETLSIYDVVFLGDVGVGEGELTQANAEMIKGLVEQQGSGLVFLPGMRGRENSIASSPLADLLPVEFDRSRPGGFGSSLESQLALTSRGGGHLLTMLATDAEANAALWKRLPGFYWYAPVERAKSGADVLAVHSVARNEYGRIPLLVSADHGNGKVLFMGTDSAWRWRRGVEDLYHYRFWGQVVRWMAHKRHLAHEEGIRFFFSPELPMRGDKISLHATAYDSAGTPLGQDATVYAQVTGPAGRDERVPLTPGAGGWGVFDGEFVPELGGRYGVVVKCEQTEKQVVTELIVGTPKRERRGRPAGGGVLREIASVSRGKAGGIGDLEDIVGNLLVLPEIEPAETRFRLWCHPAWVGLIVLTIALYWAGRKLLGQI